MNEFDVTSAIQLDRLVDGELSEPERREVLVALDREECSSTCGWRRLALTFVEAQALRQDLRRTAFEPTLRGNGSQYEDVSEDQIGSPMIGQTITAHSQQPANKLSQLDGRNSVVAGRQMATFVVCCLFAFGFGRVSSFRPGEIASIERRVEPMVGTFAESDANQIPDELALAANSPSPIETQQTLRLVLDDFEGGPSQSVDVPVVSNSEIDPIEFLDAPPSVPLAVRQSLLRQGRVVHEQRQLFEVELSDGRRGVVPISDVSVFDAGTDVFQ